MNIFFVFLRDMRVGVCRTKVTRAMPKLTPVHLQHSLFLSVGRFVFSSSLR